MSLCRDGTKLCQKCQYIYWNVQHVNGVWTKFRFFFFFVCFLSNMASFLPILRSTNTSTVPIRGHHGRPFLPMGKGSWPLVGLNIHWVQLNDFSFIFIRFYNTVNFFQLWSLSFDSSWPSKKKVAHRKSHHTNNNWITKGGENEIQRKAKSFDEAKTRAFFAGQWRRTIWGKLDRPRTLHIFFFLCFSSTSLLTRLSLRTTKRI